MPALRGFRIELSNQQRDDPDVDVDWRFRAAPGSMRGYLDGHDTFKIAGGLISALTQTTDREAAAEAFLPPPTAPVPADAPVSTTTVVINEFLYGPDVIQVPVG